MSIFVNRDGSISVVRVGTVTAFLGVVFVVAGFIWFSLEQQRFGSPLDVDLYPGAEVWGGTEELGPGLERSTYRVPGVDAETVTAFYNDAMYDYYGTSATEAANDEECQRFPVQDIFDDYEEGNGLVPFYYLCLFNDSEFGNNRYTQVMIQPGVRNDETGLDTTGNTVLVYEHYWQP